MTVDVVNLDLESRSAEDIKTAGAHRYSHHPSTEILSLAWSVNHQPGDTPQLWIPGDPVPEELARAIINGARVEAWNAQFERVMWHHFERYGFPAVDLRQWHCTMVRAYLMGYPGKLDKAAPTMGLGETKDEAGHRVMLQVSKPRKTYRESDEGFEAIAALATPRAHTAEYTSYFDQHTGEWVVCQWWVDSDRLGRLYSYNQDDVIAEAAASRFLDPLPPLEHAAWCLDQRINDRGFYLDTTLINSSRAIVKPAVRQANEKLARLTFGELKSITKPNEIRAWINQQLGLELDSIKKDVLEDLLHQIEHGELGSPDNVTAVIRLRMSAAKTSTEKLNAMMRGICDDGRIHGGLQFAGAGRTNRWAGRIVQPHNFPRPPKWAVKAVDEILAGFGIDVLDLLYDEPLEVVSAILRSCIVAEPGNELHVADYNAIEARITAWISGAERLLDAYHTGKDPYRMQAATVYGIEDWESIDKEAEERQLGKKIILGCGFGMGVNRFWESCREDGLYISKELAERAVAVYREDNYQIKDAWYELDRAAKRAVNGEAVAALGGKVWFYRDKEFLRCRLPSGRVLSYAKPYLKPSKTSWGSDSTELMFWGWNGQKNRMEWQKMYGGRWMENIVQATARDVLLDSMLRLDADGWHIILTVHDEILNEEPKGARVLKDMITIMGQPPRWAPDLPLKAEGWTGIRYRK